ncbi:SDR family oxidoreductase [Planosporangium sp. 12N6]|uniref:SDR family oxidoreductase n=1 Tax=Planosporangium spinosum TaxID=3402278 RepID=UPI003CF915D0
MAGRILVTGASGYLGRYVAIRARAAGWSVVGTHLARATDVAETSLDVRDASAVRALVERVRPDAVIHAAVGRDRDDWRTTADGAAHVAVAAAATGTRLVHVSSDAVFRGGPQEYDEAALPEPVYRYGAAKAAAETAVRAVAPDAAVVRTSLVLGDGNGGHETLTRALASGRVDGVLFTDEIRKPVHVCDLADALLELVTNGHRGVLNVAGADAISRYDLGLLVAARYGLDPSRLTGARMAEVGVQRPADVRLRLDLASSVLRTRLRGAREFLADPIIRS